MEKLLTLKLNRSLIVFYSMTYIEEALKSFNGFSFLCYREDSRRSYSSLRPITFSNSWSLLPIRVVRIGVWRIQHG